MPDTTREEQLKLFNDNKHVALKLASRYISIGVEIEDLKQEALLSLWESVLKYDETKGTPEKYFYFIIKGALGRYVAKNASMFSRPEVRVKVQSKVKLMKRILDKYQTFSEMEVDEIMSTIYHPLEEQLTKKDLDKLLDIKLTILGYTKKIRSWENKYEEVVNESKYPIRSDAEIDELSTVTRDNNFIIDSKRALANLPAGLEVLYRLKLQGYSTRQISNIMKESTTTIFRKLTKAKDILTARYSNELQSE